MGSGRHAKNVVKKKTKGEKSLQTESDLAGSSRVQRALQDYSSGKVSLQDAIANAQQGIDTTGLKGKALKTALSQKEALPALLQREIATSPLTGTRFAEEQLGKTRLGGLLGRLDTEEQKLASQGFQLTPEDREAYGQAAGDITRKFGRAEQSLAQTLANRGLTGAPSGAAGAAFSGLSGNKLEMLAKQQRAIADDRMRNTLERLQQTRSLLSTLGSSELQAQFGRQLAGRETSMGERERQARLAMGQRQLTQDQLNREIEQEEMTAGPGIGEILGGIGMGVATGLTGGAAAGIGAGLTGVGKAVAGGGGSKQAPAKKSPYSLLDRSSLENI